MKKNDLLINNNSLIRLLNIVDDKILVIDCIKCTMPKIVNSNDLNNYTVCENNVFDAINILNKNNNITSKYKSNIDISELSPKDRKIAHNRYSMIVPILPHIALKSKRSEMINIMANINNISTQSIKHYLCKYLVYQNISVLAPETSFNENKLVRREFPFFTEISSLQLESSLNKEIYEDEKVRLQGIIDLFFQEDDEIVLLDYKTDYVEEGNEEELIERYTLQLKYYKDALEKITGKKVKESYLYLFYIDKAVKL